MSAVTIHTEDQEVRATVSLRESGNSTVITIPPQVLDAVGFEDSDDVEIVGDWGEQELRLTLAE